MKTGHVLLGCGLFVAGFVVGAVLMLSGTSEPKALPPPTPTPASSYACRVLTGMSPEQSIYRLQVNAVSGATSYLAMTCTPNP